MVPSQRGSDLLKTGVEIRQSQVVQETHKEASGGYAGTLKTEKRVIRGTIALGLFPSHSAISNSAFI